MTLLIYYILLPCAIYLTLFYNKFIKKWLLPALGRRRDLEYVNECGKPKRETL